MTCSSGVAVSFLPVAYSSAPLEFRRHFGCRRGVPRHHCNEVRESPGGARARGARVVGRIRDALDEHSLRALRTADPRAFLRAVAQHELLIRMVDRDGAVIAPNLFFAYRGAVRVDRGDRPLGHRRSRAPGRREHAVTLQFTCRASQWRTPTLQEDPVGTNASTAGTPPACLRDYRTRCSAS